MNFHCWDIPAPEQAMVHDSISQASFSTLTSSHFKRPSKVVKPSSRNNSPRNNARRRMTTTGHYPARTRSVVDYQRASMPQFTQCSSTPSRPISWHPHSMEETHPFQISNPGMIESFVATPYTAATAEMSGLVTPMSYPILDEPQIQELITPLEELSAGDAFTHYQSGQDFSLEAWLSQQRIKSSHYDYVHGMFPTSTFPAYYHPNRYTISNETTLSPSQAPLSEFDSSPVLDEVEVSHVVERDDLVGMGLYDSPAQVQSSTLLFGTFGASQRKSLKLEDAFEPAPESEDDEDDDCEEEEDSEYETQVKSDQLEDAEVAPTHVVPLNSQQTQNVPVEFTYIVAQTDNTHYPTMTSMNQWPMQNQPSYGWI